MSDRLLTGIKGTKARPGVSSRLCPPPARGEGARLLHWGTWTALGREALPPAMEVPGEGLVP